MSERFVPEALTFTLGPDVFEVRPVIDLGGPCVVNWAVTVLALAADGLTLGGEAGNLGLDVQDVEQSDGNIDYAKADAGTAAWFADVPYLGGGLPHLGWRGVGVTARFFRPIVHLCDGKTLNTWEGGSHPTATCRIDLRVG